MSVNGTIVTTSLHNLALEGQLCPTCGAIGFYLESWLSRVREKPDRHFYCPNGHRLNWADDPEVKRLKSQLKDAREGEQFWLDAATEAEREVRALKKAALPICPTCGKHIKDLARHTRRVHAT